MARVMWSWEVLDLLDKKVGKAEGKRLIGQGLLRGTIRMSGVDGLGKRVDIDKDFCSRGAAVDLDAGQVRERRPERGASRPFLEIYFREVWLDRDDVERALGLRQSVAQSSAAPVPEGALVEFLNANASKDKTVKILRQEATTYFDGKKITDSRWRAALRQVPSEQKRLAGETTAKRRKQSGA